MRRSSVITFLFLILGLPLSSSAQSDFANQLLSAGRYEVRQAPAKESSGRSPASENVKLENVTNVSSKAEVQSATVVIVNGTEKENESADVVSAPATAVDPAPLKPEVVEPDLEAHAKSLLGSEDLKIIEFYQERIHPDDVRLNKVEIQISPGLTNLDSKSNYSYRNYQSSFTEIDLKSNVWLTPLIGLTGGIRFAMGAAVRGDSATGSMDHVKSEKMEIGVKFRRYFGLSRKSSSMEFELVYIDDAFNVSTDSVSRVRTRSSGLGAGVHATLPSSAEHAWVLGGSLAPRLKHQESNASLDVRSGSPLESVRIGLDAGGEWRFSRGSQFLYGIRATSEKNIFDGPASLPDPDTGQTPSNVTVTNTHVNFSFGYRWGH
jgi:hypothetical protein